MFRTEAIDDTATERELVKADLVVHSAAVFDGYVRLPAVTAIAMAGGRIVALGSDDEVRAVVSHAQDVVDARGGLVTPGFVDAHMHPVIGGFERLRCDVTSAQSAAHTLELIAEYARSRPGLDWIVGGGWHMPHFPGGMPAAAALEKVAPGRPIYLVSADHHTAWASPEALRRAGITNTTVDPATGRIDRDDAGVPTGTFQESAMELFAHALPAAAPQDYVDALVEAQRYAASVGITGWQDAIVGEYAGYSDIADAYVNALEQDVLTARVSGALWLERGITARDARDVAAALAAKRDRLGTLGFRANTVKIMQDGVAETQTAAMKTPYLDRCGQLGSHCGDSHFAPDVLAAVVPALAAAGFQIHAHAIGDRALAEVLDSLAAARAAGDTGVARHHVAHLQAVDPVDIARMADLGVTANLQAIWACNDAQMEVLTRDILGTDRYHGQFPFADFAKAGIPLAMGSDWPVSSPDPWQAVHVAVTRQIPGDIDTPPLAPAQALDLRTALAAYTSGSARVTHLDEAGAVRVGAMADLAIADRDPFGLPVSELHTVGTATTVVAGTVVHG